VFLFCYHVFMKVLVTGNAGAGKFTVSKIVAAKLGIPRYNLDPLTWGAGWKKVPREIRNKNIDKIAKKDSWVIDGVSPQVLEVADQIVFLDYPRRVCFWRAAKRSTRYLFRTRPELPKGSPEILILKRLAVIIWRFPHLVVPNILAQKDRRPDSEFIHIHNNKDLQNFLSNLG
jgi:adenylate kinase family enzyme